MEHILMMLIPTNNLRTFNNHLIWAKNSTTINKWQQLWYNMGICRVYGYINQWRYCLEPISFPCRSFLFSLPLYIIILYSTTRTVTMMLCVLKISKGSSHNHFIENRKCCSYCHRIDARDHVMRKIRKVIVCHVK